VDVLVDGELVLYGTVGDGFLMPGFTARDVVDALARIGRTTDITVRINSGGGYTDEGVAIFNALKAHRGDVTVFVDGMAASAASAIAMAGDTVVMRTGALMMIHDPSGITVGDVAEHQKSLDWLEHTAAALADIYAEKSGKAADECRADMRDETWLSAEEAVAQGYADEVQADASIEPTAFDYRVYAHAPERLVAMATSNNWSLGKPKAPPTKTATGRSSRPAQRSESMVDKTAPAATAGIDQAIHDAALKAATDKGLGDGAKAATDRLAAVLAADGIKGDGKRMAAALDLAVKSPAMSATDVAAFVTGNVTAAAVDDEKPEAAAAAYEQQRLATAGQAQPGGKPRGATASIDANAIFASRAAAAKNI
jgi:ATP-dependent Clp protease protease subunit